MKNTVTQKQIDELIETAEIDVKTVFDKCTLVTVKLKNGFVLTDSSACVDKSNYSEKIGKEICLEHIKNKLWELEGYKLQCEIAENRMKLTDETGYVLIQEIIKAHIAEHNQDREVMQRCQQALQILEMLKEE